MSAFTHQRSALREGTSNPYRNWFVAEQPGKDSMAELEETAIRERAHQLWEAAGKPEGKEEHFWLEAERQLKNERIRHELKTPDNL
jgi:hypothetical protein